MRFKCGFAWIEKERGRARTRMPALLRRWKVIAYVNKRFFSLSWFRVRLCSSTHCVFVVHSTRSMATYTYWVFGARSTSLHKQLGARGASLTSKTLILLSLIKCIRVWETGSILFFRMARQTKSNWKKNERKRKCRNSHKMHTRDVCVCACECCVYVGHLHVDVNISNHSANDGAFVFK